jgi:23S rRNA pseudouridine1911/1915/1917 synthase
MRMMVFEWQAEEASLTRTFLKHHGVSRRMLSRIKFHGGQILVNGVEQNVRHPLRVGDKVTVMLPSEGKQEIIEAIDLPIDILFEDDHYIAVNKPAGYTSIPSQYNPQGSMANILKAYYQKQNYENQVIHVVTRLDRDTSGVMLFAKHAFAHGLIDQQMQKQGLEKTYIAIANQRVKDVDHGFIDDPIARSPRSIVERRVHESGQDALTEFWLDQEIDDVKVYRVQLHTGRTHQIRVHFAFHGAPLIGDDLYGGSLAYPIQRQALHCQSLKFRHHFTGEMIEIKGPVPDDISSWLPL